MILIVLQWLAANMNVSTLALGALSIPIFNLGFVDTALTIIFINILGIIPVCFFSTFGPRFGLRQMVLSKFYFGHYGVKLSKCRCFEPLSPLNSKTGHAKY